MSSVRTGAGEVSQILAGRNVGCRSRAAQTVAGPSDEGRGARGEGGGGRRQGRLAGWLAGSGLAAAARLAGARGLGRRDGVTA